VLYLNVPFSEKDIAKARGARWNPQNRHWYVWPSADLSQFDKWLPPSYAARQILERAKKHLLEQIK
jgi:hypothetical protein